MGGVAADYFVGGGDLIRSSVRPGPDRATEWPLDYRRARKFFLGGPGHRGGCRGEGALRLAATTEARPNLRFCNRWHSHSPVQSPVQKGDHREEVQRVLFLNCPVNFRNVSRHIAENAEDSS